MGEVEDLATLSKLDEQVLLYELKSRYDNDKIYTYVGDILVSVNPYRDLGIYSQQASDKYKWCKRNEHPPHIFAIADTAYQDIMGTRGRASRNQCILISGESGAGKTESTKLIITQLINISKGNTQLEQQIIQVNPLLEAFGNAQTVMNDNSSRFGRYIQLKFKKGSVVGSKISEYLLEKSRVVQQNEGEENFHIFYYMFAGLSPEELNKFHLKGPSQYCYLSDGGSNISKKSKELKEKYEGLINAMDMVGFTDEEEEGMFTIISSVLNIGNIAVEENEDNEAIISSGPGTVIRTVADNLMGLRHEELHAVLTSSRTVTKGDEVKRNYSKAQAIEARDAIAKALYGRLFSWIINKVNLLLAADAPNSIHDQQEIGILDIFGFEHFEHNSFEQACINLANEQLQFFFNKHVFTLEQEEYRKEGIDWKEIKFVDNQPLLDLFLGKPIGILSLLDEECQIPKGSDLGFVEKMSMKFDHDARYTKSPHSRTGTFTIHHYAGKVIYNAQNWLNKNRDTLPPGVMQMLQISENHLVSTIFKGKISRTGTLALQSRTSKRTTKRVAQRAAKEAKDRKLTVGAQFRNSLKVLMERMTESQPIFIRCIKPNECKKPGVFEEKYVSAQLLYTGMLETTKIRREGFAVRPSFAEFTEKYCFLAYQAKMDPNADNCKKILECSKLTGWHVGKTKVFLKYFHVDALVERLEKISEKVIHIQRVARGFLGRRKVVRAKIIAEKERQQVAELIKHIESVQLLLFNQQQSLITHDIENRKDFSKPKQQRDIQARLEKKQSTESYMQPVSTNQIKTVDMGTDAVAVSDSSDDDVTEDDFTRVKTGGANRFGPQGSRQASIRWFKETQMQTVKNPHNNNFSTWFHGIITRRESERLLSSKQVGCFLIRVSESRFGYTLSFRAEDRCRHYMIDQLPNKKYIVIGEPKVHRSLHELVNYHQRIELSNWNHRLGQPCGQESGRCDYFELVSEDTGVYQSDQYRKDEQSGMYFEPQDHPLSSKAESYKSSYGYNTIGAIDAKLKMSTSEPPPLPERLYSVQRSAETNNKPIYVPPSAYEKLLENQRTQHDEVHKYAKPGDENQRKSRLSTTRHRLPKH